MSSFTTNQKKPVASQQQKLMKKATSTKLKTAKTADKAELQAHTKIVRAHLKRTGALLTRRSFLVERLAAAKNSYFDTKDVKSDLPDREIKLIDDEIKLMRETVRSFRQFSSLKITFFSEVLYTASAAGILNSILSLNPSTLSEFTSCAALFDEFRMVGGEYHYTPFGPVTVGVAGAPINSKGVFGYDPSDNTAYAAVVSGMQDQQHQMFSQCVAAANTVSTVTTVFGRPEVFKWHTPSGVLVNDSLSVSNWQPTGTAGGALLPYGYLKTYSTGWNASAGVIGGIMHWHCEFRIRE